MSTQSTTPAPAAFPSIRTLSSLALGGAVGLFVWELWARFVTPAVIGFPLEPAGLIDALAQTHLGVAVPYLLREAIHYAIGIIGYPIAYFVITRWVPRWSLVLDLVTFITFTIAILLLAMRGEASAGHLFFWLAVAALIVSRVVNPSPRLRDALVWGNFTWFNALGIMAPLAGLSFYALNDSAPLSFMSFVGHVIYGAIAALVYDWRMSRA